ncbi:MAG: hypothetical protein Q8K85_01760 [Hyphomicrobium sp.]|nr:hypothetical protein [Hyphomicrobium sp.]
MGGNAAFTADVCAGLARDQGIVTAAHLALGLVRETFVQPFGNHEAEDAIPKKFEPFIGGPASAAMGQRLLVKRQIFRLMAECGGKEGA